MTSPSTSDFLKRSREYCAKAERCTQDVMQKFTSWEVPEEEINTILENLQREKYLDDTRFSNSYVADKWKLDQWGKGKIKNGLLQKGVSDVLIQNALDTIDQEGYISGMHNLLAKKRDTVRAETLVQQMKKILSFGNSRGFEEELIWQWLEREGLSFDV